MFLKTFFVKWIRSLLIYVLGFVPAPRLIPVVAPRKDNEAKIPEDVLNELVKFSEKIHAKFPELKRESPAPVGFTAGQERIESFRVNDRFKRARDFLKRKIRQCDSYLVGLRDKFYIRSLLTTTVDEYGVLTFPMNIPEKDTCFYRWNMMAGTIDTRSSKGGFLRPGDIDQVITEMVRSAEDNSKMIKRLKAARSQIRDSDRLAYDMGRDRIIVRW